MRTPDEPWKDALATEWDSRVNLILLDRLQNAFLSEWMPTRWSVLVVKAVAPAGIVLGLAAAIVGAV